MTPLNWTATSTTFRAATAAGPLRIPDPPLAPGPTDVFVRHRPDRVGHGTAGRFWSGDDLDLAGGAEPGMEIDVLVP